MVENHLAGLGLDRQKKESGGDSLETYISRELDENLSVHEDSIGTKRVQEMGLLGPELAHERKRNPDVAANATLFTALSSEFWIKSHSS